MPATSGSSQSRTSLPGTVALPLAVNRETPLWFCELAAPRRVEHIVEAVLGEIGVEQDVHQALLPDQLVRIGQLQERNSGPVAWHRAGQPRSFRLTLQQAFGRQVGTQSSSPRMSGTTTSFTKTGLETVTGTPAEVVWFPSVSRATAVRV